MSCLRRKLTGISLLRPVDINVGTDGKIEQKVSLNKYLNVDYPGIAIMRHHLKTDAIQDVYA